LIVEENKDSIDILLNKQTKKIKPLWHFVFVRVVAKNIFKTSTSPKRDSAK